MQRFLWWRRIISEEREFERLEMVWESPSQLLSEETQPPPGPPQFFAISSDFEFEARDCPSSSRSGHGRRISHSLGNSKDTTPAVPRRMTPQRRSPGEKSASLKTSPSYYLDYYDAAVASASATSITYQHRALSPERGLGSSSTKTRSVEMLPWPHTPPTHR